MLKKTGGLFFALGLVVVIVSAIALICFHADAFLFGAEAIAIHSDYPVAVSLEEMTEQAELVVLGWYTNFDSKWNMARNPQNISEEDPDNYVEGWLYDFEINDVLKGTVESSSILVNHRYSQQVTNKGSNAVIDGEGRIVQAATEENPRTFTVHEPMFIEPELNCEYMLFLLKDNHFGNYYAAVEPFSIKIDNGIPALQSNLINNTEPFREEVEAGDHHTIEILCDPGAGIEDFVAGHSLEEVIQIVSSNGNKNHVYP